MKNTSPVETLNRCPEKDKGFIRIYFPKPLYLNKNIPFIFMLLKDCITFTVTKKRPLKITSLECSKKYLAELLKELNWRKQ
jgi:hypothetical protein